MSGHSKWAQIKHKKMKEDAKRGAMFTKLIREITVAARESADPNLNPKLRRAIENAKSYGMPKENIENAIKRASGELGSIAYEHAIFEGYGPGNIAILIDTLTDNKKRTSAEIRHIFSKYGGKLGESGCVSWQFIDKGVIYIDKGEIEENKLYEIALENGAEDVIDEGNTYRITTSVEKFFQVKDAIEKNNIKYSHAEITKLPQTTIKLEEKEALQLLKLINIIEEQDDVQKVYANYEVEDEVMEKAQSIL